MTCRPRRQSPSKNSGGEPRIRAYEPRCKYARACSLWPQSAVFAVGAAANDNASEASANKAALKQVFANFIKPTEPGCSVGVARNGAIVHSSAYGLADLSAGKPLTADSVFNIASVSKNSPHSRSCCWMSASTIDRRSADQAHSGAVGFGTWRDRASPAASHRRIARLRGPVAVERAAFRGRRHAV